MQLKFYTHDFKLVETRTNEVYEVSITSGKKCSTLWNYENSCFTSQPSSTNSNDNKCQLPFSIMK